MAEWPDYPCRNPQCPSYGSPHPNCRCGAPMAEGGSVEHFCAQDRQHGKKCQYYAEGGPITVPSPQAGIGHYAATQGLSGLLKRLGHKDHAGDYLAAAAKGHKQLESRSKGVLGDKIDETESPSTKELEDHLQYLKENPQEMLNIGGSLGEYMPGHSAQLAATAAQSVNYLDALKPKPSQAAPLDKISIPSAGAQEKYHRQLMLAENPLLALRHLNRGTLQPQDLQTVQTLYPALHKSMADKMGERLIEAKTKGKEIPYHQRRSLGLLMGQPMDSTMTPQSAQAIMKANAGAQAPQSQPQQGKPKKASGAELKQIDKVNDLYKTQLDKGIGK